MKSIILFILLWGSPIPEWLKFLLTTLWVLEVLCTSSIDNTNKDKEIINENKD